MSEYPCDGECSYGDGPDEQCSAHGRSPADLWGIIGSLAQERDRALARIERVEALHSPRTIQVLSGDCAIEECGHEDECPTRAFEQCVACDELADSVSTYYAEEGVSVTAYPCPTVRALTEGENE